jgi:hypothetical protein
LIRSRRTKPRRGKDTPATKTAVRLAVYERAEGRCELNLVADCIQGVLPFTGVTPWDHGHAVHLKSTGAGGRWTMENIKWGCHPCHLVGMHNPKSVPAK